MQVLSLNKINKQIKDKIILKDISFTLEEGEILGLLGLMVLVNEYDEDNIWFKQSKFR